jgi:hypothetical protein
MIFARTSKCPLCEVERTLIARHVTSESDPTATSTTARCCARSHFQRLPDNPLWLLLSAGPFSLDRLPDNIVVEALPRVDEFVALHANKPAHHLIRTVQLSSLVSQPALWASEDDDSWPSHSLIMCDDQIIFQPCKSRFSRGPRDTNQLGRSDDVRFSRWSGSAVSGPSRQLLTHNGHRP